MNYLKELFIVFANIVELYEKINEKNDKNIEFNDEDVYRIRVNTKTKISYEVYPKTAIDKNIKYSTDNKKLLSVDKDGVIEIRKKN